MAVFYMCRFTTFLHTFGNYPWIVDWPNLGYSDFASISVGYWSNDERQEALECFTLTPEGWPLPPLPLTTFRAPVGSERQAPSTCS